MLVSQAIGAAVARIGVDAAFGLAGSGNLLTINAMRDGGVEYHGVCHEAGAVAMADGYARVTGRVGVASVHQGPGFTNTLTALTEAVRSHTPLVVLAAEGTRGNQALDQAGVAAAVGAGVERLQRDNDPAGMVAGAYARAVAERRPVVLLLPVDVQDGRYAGDAVEPPRPAPPAPVEPPAREIAAANAAIREAHRPLIVAGRGAVGAGDALRELGARIGAVLSTTIVAKGLFSGDPFDAGILGGFASPLAHELARDADLVLAFGASLDAWTTCGGRVPNPGTPLVWVDDRSPAPRVTVHGDARLTAERLGGDPAGTWRTPDLARRIAEHRRADDIPATGSDMLDPRRLAAALDAQLPRDRIVAVDSGHFLAFAGMFVGAHDGRSFLFAQGFQSVGLGLGVGIGGAVAGAGRIAAVLVGDGGAQMSLLELDTAVRHALSLVVAVFNDDGYGAELHDFEPHGVPADVARFPGRDFAALGRAMGASSATVRSLEDLEVLTSWLERPSGPLVLDCKVDPEVDAVSVMSESGAAEWSMPAPGSIG